MECEKELTPTLEGFLDTRNIQGVCFDVDNTVFATDLYFAIRRDECYLEIAQNFPYPNEDPQKTTKNISDFVHQLYIESNRKVFNVNDLYFEGLKNYYKDLYDPKMGEIFHNYFRDFYEKSPDFLPDAKELFSYLSNYKNMKLMVGNSLAQREWTDIKIEKMKRECGINRIPYFTTDIDKPKDWTEALQFMRSEGLEHGNILAMGDTLETDIIPAIEVGFKHIIWIDWRGRATENIHKLPDTAEVVVVNNLEQIFDLE